MNDDKYRRFPSIDPEKSASDEPFSGETRRPPRPSTGRDEHQNDRDRRPARGFSGADKGERQGHSGPAGSARALAELDLDIMKLLVRRAKLVSRIREGRDHAASPAAIQAEKTVRKSWEKNALSFSTDIRFARQLFSLLQEVNVLSREATPKDSYNLAPSKAQITADVTGPTASLPARMWLMLAASLGQEITLSPVLTTDALTACVKVCTQAEAEISWSTSSSAMGSIHYKGGKPAAFNSKTIFFGDDLFSLYFFSFVAIATPNTSRLAGGALLKNTNLVPLRYLLPQLGARLAHLVPHSQGLPAALECSGVLPETITVPSGLPFEGVCALLLAPLCWAAPVTINLEELPAAVATAALAAIDPVLDVCAQYMTTRGATLVYTPSASIEIPKAPVLTLDAELAAYQLAAPAFTSGSVTLKGTWPDHMPDANAARALLEWGGLTVSVSKTGITATRQITPKSNMPLHTSSLPPEYTLAGISVSRELAPLLFIMAAARLQGEHEVHIPLDLLDPESLMEENAIAEEAYAYMGLVYENELLKTGHVQPIAKSEAWFSPTPYWSMAFALAAFSSPGLKIANPGDVSTASPIFWAFFNAMPFPSDPAVLPSTPKEVKSEAAPTRRRIIADR